MNDAQRKQYYDTTDVEQPYPDGASTTEHKRRGEHTTEPVEGPDDPGYTGGGAQSAEDDIDREKGGSGRA